MSITRDTVTNSLNSNLPNKQRHLAIQKITAIPIILEQTKLLHLKLLDSYDIISKGITYITNSNNMENIITGTVTDQTSETIFRVQLTNQEYVDMDLQKLIKEGSVAVIMNNEDWNKIKQKTKEQINRINKSVEKRLIVPQLISQDKFWSGVAAKAEHQVNGYSSQRNYNPS